MTSKWIYKIKHAVDGIIEKHKTRFDVARCFSEKEGIDYTKTFVPVERYTSIIYILSLVAAMRWKIHHMGFKTSFLNGVVEEEVYVEQPLGFETHEMRTHVCKLKNDLYRFK